MRRCAGPKCAGESFDIPDKKWARRPPIVPETLAQLSPDRPRKTVTPAVAKWFSIIG